MNTVVKVLPVIGLINGLCGYYGKGYCFPSQTTFLKLLRTRYDIDISLATLNRWMRVIEDSGFMRRIRRMRHDRKLGTVFESTLYILRYKACVLLARQGVAVWRKVRELAAATGKKLSPGSGAKKTAAPAGELFHLVNHKKRHPGLKLPWDHSPRGE